MEGDLSNFTIALDTPISRLDACQSFNGLSNKEKLYCHYLSRASWEGCYICLFQTSPESVPVFLFLREIFSWQNVSSLKAASESRVSEEEYKVQDASWPLVFTVRAPRGWASLAWPGYTTGTTQLFVVVES